MQNKLHVGVAMSGGVDSSVAAKLLQEKGYQISGYTLKLTDAQPGKVSAWDQAKIICDLLEIPHYVIDCREAFREKVLRYSWDEYFTGRTPNPCVVCNPMIKFGVLLDQMQEMGATKIATGHFARIRFDEESGFYNLYRSKNLDKDQSYFLFGMSQKQLSQTMFPIENYSKDEIRKLAERYILPNAAQRESQDACIAMAGDKFSEILKKTFDISVPEGFIVDETGHQLAKHQGIHRFTIGQRKGLGVALGTPAYVTKIDPKSQKVFISSDKKKLLAQELLVADLNWCGQPPVEKEIRCKVKIRYRHTAAPATIRLTGKNEVLVAFDTPQNAITPGQASVFYLEDRVLGGGFIKE